MIPYLFKSNATDFSGSGYGRLERTISCTVTQELGSTGVYELNMQILTDDPNFKNLIVGRIIVAKPNFTDQNQGFVIQQISKPINNIVTVYAVHVAQHRAMLIPVSPINANSLQSALTSIMSSTLETNPFNLHSPRTSNVAYKTNTPRSLRDIMGGKEGSLLDVYGGEYIYNNFDIRLVNRRGRETDIQVAYGNNMTSFQRDEEFSFSTSITGIKPFWYTEDEGLVQGSIQYSDYRSKYLIRKTICKDYTEYFENKPTAAQLEAKAAADVKYLGSASVNMKIAFKEFNEVIKGNTKVFQLGDSVKVINPNYNVNTTARIVSMTFNVLAERYEEIQIGTLQQSINEAISDSVDTSTQSGGGASYSAGDGIQISSNVISFGFNNLNSTDLNDVKYNFIGYANTCTNYPTGTNADGVLISIFRTDNARGIQMYSPHGSTGTLYLRKYYSSTWQSWTDVGGGIAINQDLNGNLNIGV